MQFLGPKILNKELVYCKKELKTHNHFYNYF